MDINNRIKISDPIGLQISNYVYNKHGEVIEIGCNDFSRFRHPDMGGDYGVYAISLTEEWVSKLGFCDKDYKPGYIGIDYKSNLIIDFVLTKPLMMGEWQTYYVWEHVKNMYTKIEYVHSLQNLFHSITGQELKLKDL